MLSNTTKAIALSLVLIASQRAHAALDENLAKIQSLVSSEAFTLRDVDDVEKICTFESNSMVWKVHYCQYIKGQTKKIQPETMQVVAGEISLKTAAVQARYYAEADHNSYAAIANAKTKLDSLYCECDPSQLTVAGEESAIELNEENRPFWQAVASGQLKLMLASELVASNIKKPAWAVTESATGAGQFKVASVPLSAFSSDVNFGVACLAQADGSKLGAFILRFSASPNEVEVTAKTQAEVKSQLSADGGAVKLTVDSGVLAETLPPQTVALIDGLKQEGARLKPRFANGSNQLVDQLLVGENDLFVMPSSMSLSKNVKWQMANANTYILPFSQYKPAELKFVLAAMMFASDSFGYFQIEFAPAKLNTNIGTELTFPENGIAAAVSGVLDNCK